MDINLLFSWGATAKNYSKGEILFREGEDARYYFQVDVGQVKMFNMNHDGREFTQGIFENGESFGEPPLILGEKYPTTAIVMKDSYIVKLSKERFFNILEENSDIQFHFLKLLSKRLLKKAKTARAVVNTTPEERILTFLNEYKKAHTHPEIITDKILIQLTRQEIANITGLRVETVIRTLSTFQQKHIVDIKERKLYF